MEGKIYEKDPSASSGCVSMRHQFSYDKYSSSLRISIRDDMATERCQREALFGVKCAKLSLLLSFRCALTTSVLVVLTLDQRGDEEHNGAQCA
jgi:hypothetical protein